MDEELRNELNEVKRLLGANTGPGVNYAKIEDVYNRLGNVVGLLERLNETTYNLGVLLSENEDYWHKLNRNT